MRIALIGDAYLPLRSSAAVQMRDLAKEFALQGHEITVIAPATDVYQPWEIERLDGVQVLRLAALKTKDTGHVRRAISETLLPFAMLRGIRKSPLRSVQWDGLVWYSPSIFLGPLVGVLKRLSRCRSYLILRDIFPEWAVDLGLLKKGIVYRVFKLVERYQYSVADSIGVQSPANLAYLEQWARKPGRRLEVLQNWLAPAPNVDSRFSIAGTPLAGRIIFVYAGNMGIAQGMGILLDLADRLRNRRDLGFVFVGRGSEVPRLQAIAMERGLDNVLFHDEVEPHEIPGLLAQCHVGMLALDPRHRTHNVPGKFLTYVQAGLPVLARLNAGNDLASLIEREGVGRVYVGASLDELQALTEDLVDDKGARELMSARGRALAQTLFSSTVAVKQIVTALTSNG